MREMVKATLLRAADIIDRITDSDVLEQQALLLASGCSLEQVSKLDRARIASAHLRLCASGKYNSQRVPESPCA